MPVTVLQLVPQAGLTRLAGLTKPTKACHPPGPNSWKKGGSPDLTQASMTLLPSMVEVCVQVAPSLGRSGDDAVLAGEEVLDQHLTDDSQVTGSLVYQDR